MLQTFIQPRKTFMIPFFNLIEREIHKNSHLELDFNKNSLNTTCSSKIFNSEEQMQSHARIQESQKIRQSVKLLNETTNLEQQKKQTCLNKTSTCFLKEISKVLKRNKLKCYQKDKDLKLKFESKDKLNEAFDISQIHFKTKVSNKNSKTNQEIKKIIKKDQKLKQNFNFDEFVQHLGNKADQKIIKSASVNLFKKQKKQYSFEGRERKMNCFKKNPIEEKKQQSIQQKNENNYFQNFNKQIESTKQGQNNKINIFLKQNISHNQVKNDLTLILHGNQTQISKIQKDKKYQKLSLSKLSHSNRPKTSKSSRVISVKQSRAIQITKRNQQQNLNLQKSLKKAMCDLQIKDFMIQPNGCIKINSQRPATTRKAPLTDNFSVQKSQKNKNSITMQQIHFDKLRQKVMSQMQDYKKIKQIRDSQDKQRKKYKKGRTYSAQQKSIALTIQGTNLTIGKNQSTKNNFKDKQFGDRRPFTALSRTGLQYDRRQAYRRRSSDKQHRIMNLAGINNSANHFRTFSKNSKKDIEQLDQCKSDRVIRTLRQKYSRPQTAKPKVQNTSRPSTAKLSKKNRCSEVNSHRNYQGIQYEKITKKQVEKQRMKQKLYGLLIQCEEQKECNKDLMQGLNIFQDYCDNIDKGLKDITQQINQYIKKNQ